MSSTSSSTGGRRLVAYFYDGTDSLPPIWRTSVSTGDNIRPLRFLHISTRPCEHMFCYYHCNSDYFLLLVRCATGYVLLCACAEEIGNFYYGQGHPMKPHRIRMAHNLVLAYGLYKKMEIYRPSLPSAFDFTRFHSDDYINFLSSVSPDNLHAFSSNLSVFNIDVDCKARKHSSTRRSC
jgi:hypothetical protein